MGAGILGRTATLPSPGLVPAPRKPPASHTLALLGPGYLWLQAQGQHHSLTPCPAPGLLSYLTSFSPAQGHGGEASCVEQLPQFTTALGGPCLCSGKSPSWTCPY